MYVINLLQGLLLALAALLTTLLCLPRIIRRTPVLVSGPSMLPSYKNGDILLADTSKPVHINRFDVVVLRDPRRKGRCSLLKRVVALPGETIELREAVLYINDTAFEEPWLSEQLIRRKADFPPTPVPDNCVFVLGDNRSISIDSRSFGPVPCRLLSGRILRKVAHVDLPRRSVWRGTADRKRSGIHTKGS